ncbi:MAG TPA: hypothetical protein VFQ43_03725 [Nitrososphaera sp.]|nr:hypothetical protein [Nitrososphaera sp.]
MQNKTQERGTLELQIEIERPGHPSHSFYEAGLHIAQPDGTACTISTMVFEGGSTSGSNNWHCNSVGDCSTSVTSSDGSLTWGAGITGTTIWFGEARKQ